MQPAAAAMVASPTPSPLRDVRPAVRAEIEREARLGPRGDPVPRAPGDPQRHHDVRHRRPGRGRGGRPGDRPPAGGRPRAAAALGRPARRPDPDPPARHRGDRDRRLRPVRRRLLRARPPAHPGPGARRRRGAAARDLRREVRRRADRPAPGLRGRARHRTRRPDPRHPRWPELVGDRRRRDDGGAGLVGGPAGDGPPDHDLAVVAEPCRRFGRPDQWRPGRDAGPGRAHRRGRWLARRGARRHREGRLHRLARLRPEPHPAGLAAGPDPDHRRLARGERRRPGPRRASARPASPPRTSTPLVSRQRGPVVETPPVGR